MDSAKQNTVNKVVPQRAVETVVIPDGQHEGSDFGLIPEVAWRIVVKYLESLDLISTMKTSSALKTVVGITKRAEYLRPKVFELILEELDATDILNCRLVCKLWKRAVDHVMDQLPLAEQQPNFYTSHDEYGLKTFQSADNLELFIQETATFTGHPMLGRRLSLICYNENVRLWELSSQLLGNYGLEVWHLTLNFYPSGNSYFERTMPRIRALLELVPNLKSLEIRQNQWSSMDDEYLCVPSENLCNYVDTTSFPKLSDLVKFTINIVGGAWIAEKLLLTVCPPEKLKILDLRYYDFGDGLIRLPNLNWLLLDIKKPSDLACIGQINARIRKLTVYSKGYGFPRFELLPILHEIDNVTSTIEELYLLVCINTDNSSALEEPGLMRQLKVLQVRVFIGRFLEIPKLEGLEKLIFTRYLNFTEPTMPNNANSDGLGQHAIRANTAIPTLRRGDHDLWLKNEKLQVIHVGQSVFKRPSSLITNLQI